MVVSGLYKMIQPKYVTEKFTDYIIMSVRKELNSGHVAMGTTKATIAKLPVV